MLEDIVSQLVAQEGDQLWQTTELYPLCLLLLLAGFETTVNLSATPCTPCWTAPTSGGPWPRPALAAAAVEETLAGTRRCSGPSGRRRGSRAGGVTVPEGSMVRGAPAGANRDPEAYADPDRFDSPLRPRGGAEHLAFSAGIHYCLGAALARLEATVAVQRLVERFPRLEPPAGCGAATAR